MTLSLPSFTRFGVRAVPLLMLLLSLSVGFTSQVRAQNNSNLLVGSPPTPSTGAKAPRPDNAPNKVLHLVITTPPARARVAAITTETFTYSGAIVNYTVPTGVGSLTIEVRGAEGSNSRASLFRPGKGAIIIGTVAVTPGQQLKLLVGQQFTATGSNGGGGGSFVTDINNNPLIIAGGGGGSGDTDDPTNKQGQAGRAGGKGANSGGAGGISGNGGQVGPTLTYAAAAGGGLSTNGGTYSFYPDQGGKAFINGGAGGTSSSGLAPGGFGGGAAGSSRDPDGYSGGGGGGYSGGGNGSGSSDGGVGGGGGSYNADPNGTNTAGANSGSGLVIIKSTPCTPFTATLTNNGPLSCTMTSVTLTASGGTSYTFTNGSGTVLVGSGNTRTVGTSGTYSVTGTNASGCVSTTSTTVQSNTAAVSITNPIVSTATVGVAFNQSFTAAGGSGPYSYNLASGSLPTGLSLATTGVLSGSPTQAGSFTVTVLGRDANNCSAVSAAYVLRVLPACGAGLSGPVWTGCLSTDWNAAGNWASGAVPTATDDVVIPSTPANQPVLSTPATAKSVEVQSGASLSITATGSLAVNDSKSLDGNTVAFSNRGTVQNAGQLVLGNTAAVGQIGFWNRGIANNAGGQISIDRSTTSALRNSSGTFTNTGGVTIGSTADVGNIGLQVVGGTVANNPGGEITINRTTARGLLNEATFVNASRLTIGNVALSAQDCIANNRAFTNTATGEIRADRAFGNGIWNTGGTFRNDGKILIGTVAYTGAAGMLIEGVSFVNSAGADIQIDRVNRGLTNRGNFTNAGQIRMGNNVALRERGMRNGNGEGTSAAVFTNQAGGLIQIDQTASGQDGLTNEAMTTFTNAGTVAIGTLGSIGGNGIANAGTFSNSACATLTSAAPINNGNSFTNAGLFTVSTTRTHSNTGTLTNNGLISYPQGNPIPNVVNNDVVAGPISSCRNTITPALQLGGNSSQFAVGTTWYTDPALTQSAGTYDQGSNTFTATNLAPGSSTTLYVAATDQANSCTKTVSVSVTLNAPPTVTITPSATTICAGQSTTLTALGANTYTWSTGAITAAISVSAMGPYSVTGTSTTTGCSNTATASVTVTPLPNAGFTGLPASVCVDAAASTLTPTTSGGAFSGPGISGNMFSPASAGAGGPYSITYTVSSQGCPNTSVQSVTVKPLPTAPTIATQSGQSYPGGVNSLTISQNVGNVIFTASGCAGGTITWAGGNSTTLAVSTFDAGVQTFTATCTTNGCTSPLATATLTVVGTTLSVLHRDGNGNASTNTLSPYLALQNDGKSAIPYAEITLRYWLTVENYAPLLFALNYAQVGSDKVSLKYVPATTGNPGATGYIEFSFDASAGSLGAMSNSGPIQTIINKQDYSYFSQLNDYSYAAVGSFTPNERITAYRNGVLFYGLEPGPVVPTQSVKALLQNNTGDGANSIEAVLSVTNDGNVPVNYGDIKVRYYFTADNAQPLVVSQVGYTALGSGNVTGQVVSLSPALGGADRYLEVSFSGGLGQLAPGASTGGVTYQIRHADYSGFSQLNDYSYQGTGGMMQNRRVVVFVAGKRAYGTEPVAGGRQSTADVETSLRVEVLGNPVAGSVVEVLVRGAEGEPLTLSLTDVSGRSVTTRQVGRAGAVERHRLETGNSAAGLLLLRVSTPSQSQTVKVLRQ